MTERLMGNSPTARVGVFTTRGQGFHVSKCPGYEFEDLIVEELEPGAVFVEPVKHGETQWGLRAKRALARSNLPVPNIAFGAETTSMGRDVDLFFAAPAVCRELTALDTVKDWRKRARVAVCFLQELWIPEFDEQLRGVEAILQQFDHIFVAMYHTAEALSQRLGRKVAHMPLAIDAALWNPYNGVHKPRTIDVCSIGNLHADAHQSLWDWAERTGRYYSFTTTGSAKLSVSHKIHRQNLSQTLQRSKVFLTYMAKRDVTKQRGSQEEFGPRYFEGAGAGALMMGDAVTSNPAYRAHMDWDGAVIEAPYASTDMPALIEELEKKPDWIEELRRRNVAQCLTRHDHLNRWDTILSTAGLPATPAMEERRARLHAQAAALGEATWLATHKEAAPEPRATSV